MIITHLSNDHEGFYSKARAEREYFEIYNQYGYLPITTDSHIGEYLSWLAVLQIMREY